jgi:hypothetical protein
MHRTTTSEKISKRKSREINEHSDTESFKERRKEKDREKQKKKRVKWVSKTLQDNALETSNDSSSGVELVSEQTSGTDRTGYQALKPVEISIQDYTESRNSAINKDGKKRDAKDKSRRDYGLGAVAGRNSLGVNKDALLKSILKGCSPGKLADVDSKHTLPSESESEDASEGQNACPTTEVSNNPKAPSKRRQRQRVSMVPILPEGYKPGLPGSKGRFHCPIEGCEKLYTRRTTLGEHMNVSNYLYSFHFKTLKHAYRY